MSKSPRHISRCMAIQAIYSEKMNPRGLEVAKEYLNTSNEKMYKLANMELLDFLLTHALDNFDELLALYLPNLTRDLDQVNLIEKAILVVAAVELKYNLSVPAVVIINEAVELSKTYAGSDSHKFINSLVDKLAQELRVAEFSK